MTVTRPDASLGKKGPENTPKFPNVIAWYTRGVNSDWCIRGNARVSVCHQQTRERTRVRLFPLCDTRCARPAGTVQAGCATVLVRQSSTQRGGSAERALARRSLCAANRRRIGGS